jgi:hypothetical protein
MNTTKAGQPLALGSTEGLGPLPERTLAEIHNPATGESELSETGTAYYGSNWREVRKLYTVEDMRAYALQESQRVMGYMLSRCQGKVHDGCAYLGHCGMVCNKCGQVA